nr:DUF4158 domain-containing protein [Klebsiella pneumoniae]
MPRRSIPLPPPSAKSLLALPDTKDELIRHYVQRKRPLHHPAAARPANRLGFAVQLCYLRFPGVILGADEPTVPAIAETGRQPAQGRHRKLGRVRAA